MNEYAVFGNAPLDDLLGAVGRYFQGEDMRCVLCGRIERSDPGAETNWRCIEWEGRAFYACPDEFPPDGRGTQQAYADAYTAILRRITAGR